MEREGEKEEEKGEREERERGGENEIIKEHKAI